jgi:hypothetical protein
VPFLWSFTIALSSESRSDWFLSRSKYERKREGERRGEERTGEKGEGKKV